MTDVAPLQFIRGRRVKEATLSAGRTPKPDWLKVKAPGSENYLKIRGLMRELKLNTVCEEAHCPNVGEAGRISTQTSQIAPRTQRTSLA